MKKITLILLIVCAYASAQNNYTFNKEITQSTIHDAIQLQYARTGATFYFKKLKIEGGTVNDYEVIDLYYEKNLGSITRLARQLGLASDSAKMEDLIKAFLLKYNARQTYTVAGLEVKAEIDTAMPLEIIDRILARNASVAVAQVPAAYKSNEFLSWAINREGITLRAAGVETLALQSVRGADFKFGDLGGGIFSASNFARGVASFLISRANEELTAAVFRRLKTVMENTSELQILFPDTYSLTATLESYNFDVALNTLKVKINDDIRNILGNVSKLSTLKKYQDRLNQIPSLAYLFAACDIISALDQNAGAAHTLHTVYTAPYVATPTTNAANLLKLAGFLSYSLRDVISSHDNPESQSWISPAELSYDPITLNAIVSNYLGLLYASDPDITFTLKKENRTIRFRDRLQNSSEYIASVQTFISNTYTSFESMLKQVDEIRASKSPVPTPSPANYLNETPQQPAMVDLNPLDNYENIATEVLDMVEQTISFPGFLTGADRDAAVAVIRDIKAFYLPAIHQGINIVSDLRKEEYNEAVYNTGLLVQDAIRHFSDSGKSDDKLIANLFKYGQFFGSVAVAENPEEVRNAIDAVALPSGSSSIKKEASLDVAINGYIGYFWRAEGDDANALEGFTQTYGITAPVGITLSTGLRKAGSLSIFGGMLDVGAIAQYELRQDPTTGAMTAEPEIEWANIISPSAHVIYGFPFYVPLSVGAGAQWISNSATATAGKFALQPRFNFFLTVDIPIVNITSKKRKQ